MRIKMLAEHRELQINHTYDVVAGRGKALVRDGFAVEVKAEKPKVERAVAAPAPERAVAAPAARKTKRKRKK